MSVDGDSQGPTRESDEVDLTTTPVDRYGFIIGASSFHQHKAIEEEEARKRKEKETTREKKWLKMLRRWDFTQKYRLAKLERRIRKGIPEGFRGVMWYKILEAAAYSPQDLAAKNTLPNRYPNVYDITCLPIDKVPMQTLDEIERDVDRTFPNHVQFRVNGGSGQESLRRILRWYASIDPEVGYCQGMGFIAGLLLTYMPEETAFYCFGALMQHVLGPLRALYLPGLVEAKRKLFVFGCLMEKFLPSLAKHFERCNVVPTMFATEWILTIFCRGFNFDLVTRVIDVYTFQGFKVVYRVALALLKNIENDLIKQPFEGVMTSLRNIPSTVDAADVMAIAWSIPLKTEDIAKLEEEYSKTGDRPYKI